MSNIDRYKKQLKKFEANRSKWWKPEEGARNQIRILPPKDPESNFYEDNNVHFIQGAGDNGTNLAVGCTEDCKVCKIIRKMEASSDPEVNELASKCRSKPSFLMNIVDMKNLDAGVQVWRTSSERVISDLVGYICDPEWGEFFDAKNGRVVVIKPERKGAVLNYNTTLNPKTSAIDTEFLKARKDLSKFVNVPEVEQVKKACAYLTEALGVDSDDLVIAKDRLKKKKNKFRSLRD